MSHAPDERLVRRAQKGDKAAFAELFTAYERRIFGYLYRMVGDRAWAEDLAQEAFIQAHQHLHRLGPPYDFKSWIYRIASNLALDGLRRYQHTIPMPDWDSGEAPAPEPADQRRESNPEEQARLAETRAAVWRTIHQLPEHYRQVLLLREMDGLSYSEIAGVLGISLDSVRVTLHRARTEFRELYGLQAMIKEGQMACQQLDELLSAYVDGELGRADRKRVKAHIAACPTCQKKQRDLAAVGTLLAVLSPVFPPFTLRQRFLTRLRFLPPPGAETGGVDGPPMGRGEGSGGGPPVWLLTLLFGGSALMLLAALTLLGLLILPHLGTLTAASPTPPGNPTPFPTTLLPTPTPTFQPTPTSISPTPTPTASPTRTPTPFPATATPTNTPTPIPAIVFGANPSSIPAGACVTLYWETANVQAVFFDGQGVPGIGSHQACLCASRSYSLDVLLPDGSHDVRTVEIQVSGVCITPTPDTQGPPAPRPLAPIAGVVLSCRATVTLSWSAVSDPSGIAGYTVRLEERSGRTWTAVGEWGPLSATQADVPVACGLGYRWAVRAQDGAGNVGPWSIWAPFSVGID